MQAYIEETNEKMKRCSSNILDSSLLEAIQAISSYKFHAYNSVATWAIVLEFPKDAKFLNEAKISEKNIDERLFHLAIREINRKARNPRAITT
jgi:ferritin-like metal-binding protein YciE